MLIEVSPSQVFDKVLSGVPVHGVEYGSRGAHDKTFMVAELPVHRLVSILNEIESGAANRYAFFVYEKED